MAVPIRPKKVPSHIERKRLARIRERKSFKFPTKYDLAREMKRGELSVMVSNTFKKKPFFNPETKRLEQAYIRNPRRRYQVLTPHRMGQLRSKIRSGEKTVHQLVERPVGSDRYVFRPLRSRIYRQEVWLRWMKSAKKSWWFGKHFIDPLLLADAIPKKEAFLAMDAEMRLQRMRILQGMIQLKKKNNKPSELLDALQLSYNRNRRLRQNSLDEIKRLAKCSKELEFRKTVRNHLDYAIGSTNAADEYVATVRKLKNPNSRAYRDALLASKQGKISELGSRAELLAIDIHIFEEYGFRFNDRTIAQKRRSLKLLNKEISALEKFLKKR